MKALKSDLAKSLLSQNLPAKMLAEWIMTRQNIVINVEHKGSNIKVTPIVVKKAKYGISERTR